MKNVRLPFLIILIALSIVACHKDVQLERKAPRVTEKKVEVTAASASFVWVVDYPGEIGSVVKVGVKEDLSDAKTYGNDSYCADTLFSVTATGLARNTKYYYCYYTWNPLANSTSEVKSFTTESSSAPIVSTKLVSKIGAYSATVVGEVIDDGNATVTERGICWSKKQNPSMADNHISNGGGTGSFSIEINGLEINQKHYVRAYAVNSKGTAYGEELSFTTRKPSYAISVSSEPSNGGTVSGGDNYVEGAICTIQAKAATGYDFIRWTKDGTEVSTNTTYSFTVTEPAEFVANFQPKNYTIQLSADPASGGTISGGGSWFFGQQCTLTATANEGFRFAGWIEDGSKVSVNPNYSFTVTENRTLVGHFVSIPTGVIYGLFTVKEANEVYFSPGNLQYIGSNNTWKFADNQWDTIGGSQGNDEPGTTRDLFGWATSGYNHGSVCYQPWSTSENHHDYGAYNTSGSNLYDQSGMADWGYNAISNGGNVENYGWRTLTKEEWKYVINTRMTISGYHYAKACVNQVNGLILLPDHWETSVYELNGTDHSQADYSTNIITADDWTLLESFGCVFLPAAGYRQGISISQDSSGNYWSASYPGTVLSFSLGNINSQTHIYYSTGCSVRLVYDAR